MSLCDEDFERIMICAAEANISDVHFNADEQVYWRRYGNLAPLKEYIPNAADINRIINKMADDDMLEEFKENRNIDFAWSMDKWRYRVNAYSFDTGKLAMSIRTINRIVPELNDLGQAGMVSRFLDERHGLLLIGGSTCAGKTTTMAAFLNELNKGKNLHIITLEDPIEYRYPMGSCLISQREYGRDFMSYSDALKSAMRQDPDVICVAELRDSETVQMCIDAAATGHMVIATMHTSSAVEALERLESMFQPDQQSRARTMLSTVLKGICIQELVSVRTGGQESAVEMLVATQPVKNLIRNGKYEQLNSVMQAGGEYGMQTMSIGKSMLKRYTRKNLKSDAS